ncbi:Na+/H+ antiporter NhaC family protein [Pseudonocardia parietis]|uniref:H+/gluconate symporter-like permease n=1 Tax=Pseudonocardia parietis TaxID=570936 RepID=A0ABS4VUH7_9PSEU|nr:Na+/H+ antiporter NhaC family protein [Pseudonocardia parietis]MBP2367595.1 H+/gluconate symporter-like permease [Pseudonocardia parietis]
MSTSNDPPGPAAPARAGTASPDTSPPAETGKSPRGSVLRERLVSCAAVAGLLTSLVAGMVTSPPTLWGLLPIVLYAGLALSGMNITVATAVAVISALLVLLPTPVAAAELLGDSLGEMVTMIGLIIMLGAGVGEILRVTGVADTIVQSVLRVVGHTSRTRTILGVMLACLALVAALGTLAGALAIAAPILLPVVARLGFTRSATAAMMFIGGCAGLAIAPFAGSNVAIMSAAEVGYLPYLLYGAGPLALLSIVAGLLIVPWIQRRTEGTGDGYDDADVAAPEPTDASFRRGPATVAFVATLLASIVYAVATEAGTSFPLLALPVLAVVTGLAAGLRVSSIARHVIQGAGTQVTMFLLFWLLAAFFLVVDELKPFDVVLETFSAEFGAMSPLLFVAVIALLGWVGVPGATAAQVVLLDEVFGGLAASLGIGVNAWVIVLLFASKIDTYGPFPNANMVGAMGLARSSNLRSLLVAGWLVLLPAALMYAVILFFEV